MTRNETTRDEHILRWKATGGNYTWRKWAEMHGIPVHDPSFIERLVRKARPGKAVK
jgi:hypothetical protein